MARLFLECTIRAALIVIGTAAVLFAMRVKVASVKHRVWTAVLVLMLVLPAWTAWGPKAQLRLLPASVERFESAPVETPAIPTMNSTQIATPATQLAESRQRLFTTSEEILLAIYVLGFVTLLARLLIGTAKASGLIRESALIDGIMTSNSCASPVTVGCLHPAVILPAHWKKWSRQQLDVVLAHEGAHVRRRDPLVQWLALFNRAIFWFHPAAWWLECELSALAEEACDAAVISSGHDPHDYAEILMSIARDVMDSGSRINSVAVAMPGPRLPERIRTIIESGVSRRISRTRALISTAVCAALSGTFAVGTIAARQSSVDSPKTVRRDLSFEAVSVKESASGGRRFGITTEPGGRFSAHNATLRAIVTDAYQLSPQELIAGPEFDRILSQHFDIEAKAEDNPTKDQMNLMLRALLTDRFQLAVHRDTRPLPVFDLVVSKPGKIGPGLLPHNDDTNCPDAAHAQGNAGSSSISCGDMIMGPGHMTANKISMRDFAASLSGPTGRLVLDHTRLNGTFDLTLKYTPEQQPIAPGPDAVAPDPLGPSLFTALQEQLGLKLDSQIAPIDVLVIDQIEEPSPN